MRTGAASALVGGLLLTGCSDLPGDLYADPVDLTRAQAVWSDPWVAPNDLAVPEAAYGSNGQVDRTAGVRRTTYAGVDATAATGQEVAAAEQHDWTLVGATCADDEVTAVLTRGGTDPDAAAVAEVGARADDGLVDVVVTAEVPHHVDEDWPGLGPAVAAEDTCLGGGSDHPAPDLPGGEPRGDADDDVDAPSWSDDGPTADDEARSSALDADPWFASLGTPVPDPDTPDGDRRRHAPAATGTLTPGPRQPSAALAAVVGSMTGWLPTYAACSRSTGGVVTLRLDAEDGQSAGPVVARLEAVPGDAGAVSWTVTLPVVGGPDQSWVDQVDPLPDPTCLASATAPRQPVVEGTPVGLIGALQPLQE
ncbi:hypothetical protein ASC77_20825 [Nocardioides sp. Root1257]|uniref:hypothetical protein n=1 Tax=unclassified Nocardioides TaxID=2615069 RepID=UPI0006F8598A|nr:MULTISPECIES: hypothetical protein [unclassified Nocardioides]KQW45218.1 hypothetical protein ASC77_20825 [Nocardioides sp. Root1257]KRC52507.1 hypothetical protein ASE24_25235 [Nocardioides sp. Root224]